MGRRVQLIRHSTGEADAFVGLQGEITVDTTKKEFRLGDGLTAGGIPQARADLDNVDGATTTVDGKLIAADKQKLAFMAVTQAVDLDAMEALLAFITITQNVNLDTMETDVAAAAAELAFIAVTQAVDLDSMESNIATNNAKISYPDAAVVAASKIITDWISVTQAVNLDTMESNVATNNAKVSNKTHTGDMAGSEALTAQVAIITGKPALTSGLVGTDEFLFNDAGTLKRLDLDVLVAYLTSIGAALASGTLVPFQQTAAPTGWTKQTTHNNKAFRVVTGTAGSGGSSSFSTVFNKTSTNTHVLTVAQMPSHTHGLSADGVVRDSAGAGGAESGFAKATLDDTEASGSGGSHAHNMDIRVQYVDLIIAAKD